jgi:prolyl 3-hydroxylase /prolyl 3,4-dihydroxylase
MPVLFKNNDLYSFHQTEEDLWALPDTAAVMQTPEVRALRDAFLGPLRTWLQEATGQDLSGPVDGFFAIYGPHSMRVFVSLTHGVLTADSRAGHLLCHDDRLEGRRFAYVLYLVDEDWYDCV